MPDWINSTVIFILGCWLGSVVTALVCMLGWLSYDRKYGKEPDPKWDDYWRGEQ